MGAANRSAGRASSTLVLLRDRKSAGAGGEVRTRKVLLRILFTSLGVGVSTRRRNSKRQEFFFFFRVAYLGGLANFLADDFPLVVFVLLNGIEEGLALAVATSSMIKIN